MISVFILVDALGWQIVRDRPFLEDILPYRTELETVFGFSSGAIPSILTGLRPSSHGHWNLFVYDPEHSPFRWTRPLAMLPSGWINNRYVRKAVSVIGRKVSRSQGYFQIYGVPVELLHHLDICEKDDIYQPRGLAPARSIFDELNEHGIRYRSYSYHQFTDRAAMERVDWDIEARRADFYFVYLAELDAFLHRNVQSPDAVDAKLGEYAAGIRAIRNRALAADPAASMYVFSDHGMTPIRTTFDLMARIHPLGLRAGRDYLALYDATMARFWFFDPGAEAGIRGVLDTVGCGRVIREEEARRLGVDFGHRRFGDLIFLMDAGTLIHPSHMGRTAWPGMHGFHPADAYSSAALLAGSEPAIPVRNICDLFGLMLHEAGIPKAACASSASFSS